MHGILLAEMISGGRTYRYFYVLISTLWSNATFLSHYSINWKLEAILDLDFSYVNA